MPSIKTISKFSKTILIRGHKWKIRLQNEIRDEGVPCLGLCISDKRLILIERHLPEDMFVEILLHEYFHAVWFEVGIDDNEPPEWLEHMFICGLSKDIMLNAQFFSTLLDPKNF